MKTTKRIGALALALVMALSALSGCGQKNPAGSSASGSGAGSSSGGDSAQVTPMDLSQITDPYLAVSGLAGDEVVARLGDAEITAGHYLYWLQRVITDYLGRFGGQMTTLPWDTEMQEGLTFGQYMLDQALELATLHALLRQTGQAEGLTPDPSVASEAEADYVDLVLQAGSDEEKVIHMYWANLLSKDLLIWLVENSDLSGQLREKRFGEDSGRSPTDAEVNAYLDENGYFRVKHILLMTIDQETNEPLDEAAIAEKKATADDLLAQLRAAEDPIALFDDLMNEYSEDGGLATNPDGYIFNASDSLVGGFREATLALTVGQISDVVETDYGYHIMLRLPMNPDDYRDDCVGYLFQRSLDQERERLGVEKTEAFEKIDVGDFWDKFQSLQAAVQAEQAK